MVKAWPLQQKAHGVGFDWDNKAQAWEKVLEELDEFEQEFNLETNSIDHQKASDEFGDVLFSLIKFARFLDIDPENALERTNRKFIQRFQYVEKIAHQQDRQIQDLTLKELQTHWEQAKNDKKSKYKNNQ